jgi:hypothetical protein
MKFTNQFKTELFSLSISDTDMNDLQWYEFGWSVAERIPCLAFDQMRMSASAHPNLDERCLAHHVKSLQFANYQIWGEASSPNDPSVGQWPLNFNSSLVSPRQPTITTSPVDPRELLPNNYLSYSSTWNCTRYISILSRACYGQQRRVSCAFACLSPLVVRCWVLSNARRTNCLCASA